jgi:ABC-type glycerol-3-phosphate transport system permease component
MILALGGMEGGPGGRVDVPALFMLRKAFVDQKMGYACAVGIVLMLIVMSLQKFSTLVNEWGSYDVDRKRRMRLRLLYIAGALNLLAPAMMIWGASDAPLWKQLIGHPGEYLKTWLLGWSWNGYSFYFPRILRNVSWLLAIVAVPYGIVWQRLVRLWKQDRPRKVLTRAASEMERARVARRMMRRRTPGYRRATKVAGGLLVFGRHFYIWFILAFALLPLYLMIIVSFKTNTQFYQDPAGVTAPFHPENWITAWKMITPTLANSVFISVSSTLLMLFLALSAAYFFARLRMPLSSLAWNAILVLMMLPMTANLVPLFRLIRDLNLLNTLSALILVGAAQGQIFAIFMLRQFLKDIPQDLYEAAEIDGASHFRQMWTIVLPLSGPILGTTGVMHFMFAWNEFILPLIVMRDHARLPVMVQLIRMAGEYIKLWGPLMAGYGMASLPIIVLFIFSMKLFVRGMTEGAVKG